MNFKKYHVSRNLLSEKYENRSINGVGAFTIDSNYDLWIGEVVAGQTYAISNMNYVYGFFTAKPLPNTGATYDGSRGYETSGAAVVTVPSGCTWIAVRVLHNADNAMCNAGSQPLPYEPYSSEVWHDIPHYIHNTSTDIIATLPAVIYPTGTTATVGLKGQMVQSSTLSPTSPVMPQETGERTGNLYNINAKDVNNGYVNNAHLNQDGTTETWGRAEISEYIPISGDTTYTFNGIGSYNSPCYGLYDENKQLIGAYRYNGAQIIIFTSPNNARYFRFTHIKTLPQAMMVEGAYETSTMPDYEPYGIKIPISSANTTTPVYLGEVESTRRIKKFVLDGTEEWYLFESINIWQFYINNAGLGGIAKSSAMSNIAPYGATPDDRQYHEYGCYLVTGGTGVAFQMKGAKGTFTNIAAWKAYLAAQYAAGTPVTVWYILAEPTTGIVNEPLMKIGDYADEVTNVSIPVTVGENTISVDTTIQPSEVSVNYHGWHPVQDAHEHNNGAWT